MQPQVMTVPPTPELAFEIPVRVTPRSSRARLEIAGDGTLKASVTGSPVDGQANAALCELVAKVARLPKSKVEIISGHTSREKRLRITGTTQQALTSLLSPQPPLVDR